VISSDFGHHIFGTFRSEANIISETLKCLTLNDLEMPFYAKLCFHHLSTRFLCFAFECNRELGWTAIPHFIKLLWCLLVTVHRMSLFKENLVYFW